MFCLVPEAPVCDCLSKLLGQDPVTGRTMCEGGSSLHCRQKTKRKTGRGQGQDITQGPAIRVLLPSGKPHLGCQKPPKAPTCATEKHLNQDSKGCCRQCHIQTMTIFLAKLLFSSMPAKETYFHTGGTSTTPKPFDWNCIKENNSIEVGRQEPGARVKKAEPLEFYLKEKE